MSDLTRMGFVLQMDRSIDPSKHYISPGGFILNGKTFDFQTSTGNRVDGDSSKVEFTMEDFDEAFFLQSAEDDDRDPEPITQNDCETGTFEEFNVYTGEYDDPVCKVVSVSDLWFEFGDKQIELTDDSEPVKSANYCIAVNFVAEEEEVEEKE